MLETIVENHDILLKINSLAANVTLEALIKEIGRDVLIKMKIDDRGDLNNAMSTL